MPPAPSWRRPVIPEWQRTFARRPASHGRARRRMGGFAGQASGPLRRSDVFLSKHSCPITWADRVPALLRDAQERLHRGGRVFHYLHTLLTESLTDANTGSKLPAMHLLAVAAHPGMAAIPVCCASALRYGNFRRGAAFLGRHQKDASRRAPWRPWIWSLRLSEKTESGDQPRVHALRVAPSQAWSRIVSPVHSEGRIVYGLRRAVEPS